MAKPQHELTQEELWRLFPVRLSNHDPAWASWYTDERLRLASALGSKSGRMDPPVGESASSGQSRLLDPRLLAHVTGISRCRPNVLTLICRHDESRDYPPCAGLCCGRTGYSSSRVGAVLAGVPAGHTV